MINVLLDGKYHTQHFLVFSAVFVLMMTLSVAVQGVKLDHESLSKAY